MKTALTTDYSTDRKKILNDTTHYLTSIILAQGFGLLRTILLPVLLRPTQLGVWNLMTVTIGFGANAHLGLLHGFNKKVPALRALNRANELDDLKDSVFWTNLLLGIISAGFLILASFLTKPIYASALRIVAGVFVLQIIYLYYFSLLRADNRFALVSKGLAGFSFLSSGLVVLFAYFSTDRLWGALWGLIAAYPLVLCFWFYKGGYRFAVRWKRTQIADAFRLGLPLIVLTLVEMLLLSLDRWMIAWQLSDTALGIYALAIMASNLLGIVPISVANVLYPRMLERFASTQDYGAVSRLMLNPVRAMGVVMIFLISAAAIFLPVIIQMFIPKYLQSIPLIEVLVPGAFFSAIAPIAGSFVITLNQQRALIKVQLVAVSVGILLDGLFLYMGYGALGIAYGTVCCYAIYGLGYLGTAVYLARGNWLETLWFIIHLLTLFGVMVIALKISGLLSLADPYWLNQMLTSSTRLLLVSAAILPFVWLVNRKSGMLAEVWLEFKSWRTAKK